MRNKYRVDGDVVFIELNRKDGTSSETLVSIEDLPKLLKYDIKWCYLDKGSNTPYVTGNEYAGNRRSKTIQLHRFIMDAPKGLVVNHINGNGLDNTRHNLEVVSNQENVIKRTHSNSNNTSGVRGVHFDKTRGNWQVKFKKNYKTFHFGRYNNFEEAKIAAEQAMAELFGI